MRNVFESARHIASFDHPKVIHTNIGMTPLNRGYVLRFRVETTRFRFVSIPFPQNIGFAAKYLILSMPNATNCGRKNRVTTGPN